MAGRAGRAGAGGAARGAGGVATASDPFGATRSERLGRRFAGAGAATLLVVAALSWWVPLLPLVLCAIIYVIGVPASLLLERRWPTRAGRSPVPRYGLLGAALGLGAAVGLALPSGLASRLEWGWVLVFAVFTTPTGAIAGGATAWGARVLPATWVRPVALAAPVLAVAITLAFTVSGSA